MRGASGQVALGGSVIYYQAPCHCVTHTHTHPPHTHVSLSLSLINLDDKIHSHNKEHPFVILPFLPQVARLYVHSQGIPIIWLDGKRHLHVCSLREWDAVLLFKNIAANESHGLCIQIGSKFSLDNLCILFLSFKANSVLLEHISVHIC